METKFTPKKLPVEHCEGSAPVEAHEAQRLCDGDSNMLGAVVVGGRYTSDCFRYGERTLQAGLKDPEPVYQIMSDGSFTPRTRPW